MSNLRMLLPLFLAICATGMQGGITQRPPFKFLERGTKLSKRNAYDRKDFLPKEGQRIFWDFWGDFDKRTDLSATACAVIETTWTFAHRYTMHGVLNWKHNYKMFEEHCTNNPEDELKLLDSVTEELQTMAKDFGWLVHQFMCEQLQKYNTFQEPRLTYDSTFQFTEGTPSGEDLVKMFQGFVKPYRAGLEERIPASRKKPTATVAARLASAMKRTRETEESGVSTGRESLEKPESITTSTPTPKPILNDKPPATTRKEVLKDLKKILENLSATETISPETFKQLLSASRTNRISTKSIFGKPAAKHESGESWDTNGSSEEEGAVLRQE